MKRITWRVCYTSQPTVVKYCKKCGTKTEYRSSGLFRVNAQRKCLDVWLIYKCIKCDDTWNAAIYSRVRPGSLAPELLEGFHKNDEQLSFQYAADAAFLRKNGAEAEMPEYVVEGEVPPIGLDVLLDIRCDYSLAIKVSAVLRKGLSLSRQELDRLLDTGRLRAEDGSDLTKCKLGKGRMVIFSSAAEKEEGINCE